ncbi:Uncharacterized conserved protein, contains a C-terminal beta-barrel porin domain [Humidesulfovibrio mexicanus]|uniref:Uncharacterized conserved protein, contains a C-terminal beta-barrel porin domain n=1 Tax=Humidesulfovibrio mexicanus TaxID=147047 RepID=A0A239D6Y6_9BACT|nr:autotransporter outer membrane beta-barrel domain-containing protein [Humidesulfovibrio mexicanus]SNS28135.1 Uncharacterized conserved protein, contains a C-terminal beta-barrel porin domain [Humidesulfovibrio mexicanus]
MLRKIIAPLLALLLCAAAAHAATPYNMGPFVLYVRSTGESFHEEEGTKTATGDFSAAELASIRGGMDYWVERLGSQFDSKLIVNLAKVANASGSAYSWSPDTGRADEDALLYIARGQYHAPLPAYGYHTGIVFEVDYTTTPTRLLLDDNSITSTMTHEMMHALGMGGTLHAADESAASWELTKWTINADSAWGSRLYDVNGVRAVTGTTVFDPARSAARSNGDFVMPNLNADPTQAMAAHPGQVSFFPTFHGDAVDALTGGKGMPVMAGLYGNYDLDEGNVLGHPALLGSIMSYSPIRNMLFTELELAVLKDMGYSITLSEFFGKSYFPTNLGGFLTTDTAMPAGRSGAYLAESAATVVNTLGFNGAASYATGLHVYRDRLDVTQAADINASGHGAGGIRVDGVGNTVTVPAGVTVAADGSYGTGVLVSYGRENVLNLDGRVSAAGDMGIGVHMGIGMDGVVSYFHKAGVNALTNADDRYFYNKMGSDLNGALVSELNISGTLSGNLAAVKIEDDSHVAAINLKRGASLDGDILSAWNPWKSTFIPGAASGYVTQLNVGVLDAALTPDPAFSMRYDDDITGPAGISLNVKGGVFAFNGEFKGLDATVDAGATLKGSGSYLLYGDGTDPRQAAAGQGALVNNGTVAPGNSIGTMNIDGDFTNNGDLRMEFNDAGQSDTITASGAFVHNGGTGATVTVTPEAGYYLGTVTIPFAGMFSGGAGSSLPTGIDALAAPSSPTLTMVLSAGPVYTVTTTRAAAAYSQFASSGNAAGVGKALDALSGQATGDMQNLLAALDFSAADGSGIAAALQQLSPQAFNSAAQASLDGNQMLTGSLLGAMLAAPAPAMAGRSSGQEQEPWTAFVMPYGGSQTSKTIGSTPGYSGSDVGLFGGVERSFDGGLTAGLHAAYSHRQVDTRLGLGSQTRTDGLHLGAQALLRPAAWGGGFVYGIGRVGIENSASERKVVAGGFRRTSRGEWVGLAGAASLGAGWGWTLGPLSIGPVAGLDYGWSWRPGFEERGGGAADLKLESAGTQTLRSALGMQTGIGADVGGGYGLEAGLSARWMRELLGGGHTSKASFVSNGSQSFEAMAPTTGRDSLALQGDLTLLRGGDFSCTAFAGTELFRTGYSSILGGVTLGWAF